MTRPAVSTAWLFSPEVQADIKRGADELWREIQRGKPSMIDVVYAMGSGRVQVPDGPSVPVQKGTHWPADDPVVRARPELFTSDPRYGLRYTSAPPGYDVNLNEVEEATANPGERRNVRRS